MLQTQTVEPRTLELLRKLQSEPLMSSFNLVGGTALALRLGIERASTSTFLQTRTLILWNCGKCSWKSMQ